MAAQLVSIKEYGTENLHLFNLLQLEVEIAYGFFAGSFEIIGRYSCS